MPVLIPIAMIGVDVGVGVVASSSAAGPYLLLTERAGPRAIARYAS